jgi:hypothetical protein
MNSLGLLAGLRSVAVMAILPQLLRMILICNANDNHSHQ